MRPCRATFSVRNDFFPRADSIEEHSSRSAPDAGTQGPQGPSVGNGDSGPNLQPNAPIPTIEDAGLPRKRRKLSNSVSSAEHGDSFSSRQQMVKETASPPHTLPSSSSVRGNDGSLPTNGTNSKDLVKNVAPYTIGRDTALEAPKTGVHQGNVHLIMANSRRRYDEFEGESSLFFVKLL